VRRSPLVGISIVTVALIAAACSSGGSSGSVGNSGNGGAAIPASADTRYSVPGPYAAGTDRFTMPNGNGVQIWYPVAPSAVKGKAPYTYEVKSWFPGALAANPALASLPDTVPTDSYQNASLATDTRPSGDPNKAYPVLLFSHGFGSYPEQSTFLTDHLATWGFVIAAPDHQSRDLAAVLNVTAALTGGLDVTDLDNTLQFLHTQNSDPASILHGALDFTKVGVFGHSAGGGAAITMAGNPAIDTYVALAPAPGTPPPTSKPGLVMYGSSDTIVLPASVQQLYSTLPTPKRLIVIAAAGHNVFDDICEIHNGSQRLVDLLKAASGSKGGFGQIATLADDGCFPPDVSPPKVWPLIDQATTAQMRFGLGIDKSPVGLDVGLGHAYAGVSDSYYQKT
jgi:dienelactone hydrolase